MVILDTSVVYKWFSDSEEKRNEAKTLLIKHLEKTELIMVPDLLLCEIVNAWATKTALAEEEVTENVNLLKTYNLILMPVSFSLVMKAGKLAKQYSISVYDAVYIVVAQQQRSVLFTADEKLVQKVSLPFIKLL